MDPSGKKLEPPLKDFEDALRKGETAKAIDMLDRLMKDMKNNKLSKEDLRKLADQLNDLKNKLERLADMKDLKDQLKKDFEAGKISKEELDRELDRIAKQMEDRGDLKDLEELAKLVGECKECFKEGGDPNEGIAKLMKKLKEIELTDKELEDLLAQQEALEAARLAMLQALQGNGMGAGPDPGMKRPVGPEPTDSKIADQRMKGDSDPKAQQRITGFSRGGTWSRVPARDVGGTFKQAVQDAPEAIERQRVPPGDAADITKGYFKKLGGQR